MIEDARGIPPGTSLQCDVCIIGGGPAGISIAKELVGTSSSVILLEAGQRKETAEARDLLRGYVEPPQSHEPLEENRRLQWGGASAAWGGRCIPFDAIDFEKRDWVPHSGWPITKPQLDPYYDRAMALCEAGEYKFLADHTFPQTQREIIAGFDGPDVVSNPLERWSPPTHFGKRYAGDLEAGGNIRVLLNANCLRINLDSGAKRVQRIEAAWSPLSRFSVSARFFIVACGGLETTRLLLVSNDVMKNGIGNQSDNLGRYYMSHLPGAASIAVLRDNTRHFIYDFERDREQVYCRRRFWITADAQRRNRLLNMIAFFHRPPLGGAVHRNALFSCAFLAKFLLATFGRNSPARAAAVLKEHRAALLEHLKVVAADGPRLIPQLAGVINGRYFEKRRLPFVLPPKGHNEYYLFYQSEHSPNENSRVFLHSQRNAFGTPRLAVRVAFTDLDVQSIVQAHGLIRNQFEATKTGHLNYDQTELTEHIKRSICHFNSSAHQLGTTRMSANPADGVVDANCKIHDIENIYVAGGSVFPTSGHANPTLTVVALAVRLADHLKNRLRD